MDTRRPRRVDHCPMGGTATSTLFEITGSHTYATAGSFTVNISVATSGGAITALTSGIATVSVAPLTPGLGNPITATEGACRELHCGNLQDANPAATTSDFTATVTATSATGQIVTGNAISFTPQLNGFFAVNATLSFPDKGSLVGRHRNYRSGRQPDSDRHVGVRQRHPAHDHPGHDAADLQRLATAGHATTTPGESRLPSPMTGLGHTDSSRPHMHYRRQRRSRLRRRRP